MANPLPLPSIGFEEFQLKPVNTRDSASMEERRTETANFGTPYHTLSARTVHLGKAAYDDLDSFFYEASDGGACFLAHDVFRPRPRAYANGYPSGWFAAKAWNFAADAEGWTGAGGALTAAGGTASFASINAASFISSPAISIDGSKYRFLRLRLRRTAGTGVGYWHVAWSTTQHGMLPTSWQKTIPVPADLSQWSEIGLDMSDLTGPSDAGGDDWINSTITGLRIYTVGLDQTVEFDWIDIGSSGFPGEASLQAIMDSRQVVVSGLPAGFQINRGCMIGFRMSALVRSLHMVTEAATADASGVAVVKFQFGLDTQNFTTAAIVDFEKPSCVMQLDPGFSAPKAWSGRRASFSATEVFFS